MSSILDHVAKSSYRAFYSELRPTTTLEFFALRLASRLNEPAAARHYATLADQYSQSQLLAAYRHAKLSHVDVSRAFHAALSQMRGPNGIPDTRSRLCAIRIERRAIAVAILDGDRLQHVDIRQLSSDSMKAVGSAAAFITRRVMDKFRFPSAALEVIPNGHEKQRSLLHKTVTDALGTRGIAIIEIPKPAILQAFGHPALRARKELRNVMSEVYPVLNEEPGQPFTHDAAALGLYVQTERLLNIIN